MSHLADKYHHYREERSFGVREAAGGRGCGRGRGRDRDQTGPDDMSPPCRSPSCNVDTTRLEMGRNVCREC